MNEQEIDKIIEKSKKKIAISKLKKENVNMPQKSILKMVASTILVTVLGVGGAYAAATTYTQIWKEPEIYNINERPSEEEVAKCITEEEAENIGNLYLKEIGFEEDVIETMTLERAFLDTDNVWIMNSEKVKIEINGETGRIKGVQIPTWNYAIPYNYGITREKARIVARELLEKYKPEDDKGEYELVSLKRNGEVDKSAYIWYADFYKKYGELLNKYEAISIGWVPTINGLYSLRMKENIYENNEEKISKEQAVEIVKSKDIRNNGR